MKKKGYSLIELSISILIISIIIVGAVNVSSKVDNRTKISSTKERIDKIYKAIGVYLTVNGALPCPASIEIAKSSDPLSNYGVANCSTTNTGVYVSSANSDILYGMVPVSSLGLDKEFAQDGFGSKIAYMVDKKYTDSSTFGSYNSAAKIIVKESLQSGSSSQIISNEVIFAIISYGPNKYGAVPSNIASLSAKNPRSSSTAEMDNDINGVVSAGVGNFDNIITASDLSDTVFDDMVFYKTRNILVSEFDLLNLIKCPATSGTSDDILITYGTNAPKVFSWPESSYNQIVSSSATCPADYRGGAKSPTRKCGAFGLWEKNDTNNGVLTPCKPSPSDSSNFSANFCSVSLAGAKTASVPLGSGNITCDENNYNGLTIPYTCVDGVFTAQGSCGCADGFSGTNCSACNSGYSSDGISCRRDCYFSILGVTTTTVSHTTTQSPLSCSATGYTGTIAYTCNNGIFNKIGSCSCDTTNYTTVSGGLCKRKCTITGVTGIASGTKVDHASTSVNCDSGYTGVITYSCNDGTLSSVSGSCKSNCSGGTITSTSTSMMHTFTSSGLLSCPASVTGVQILVVGAGGSGGNHPNSGGSVGGGGGGGVVYGTNETLSAASYTVTVGGTTSGVTAPSSGCGAPGNSGANSSFSGGGISIVAYGGGGGGGCGDGTGKTGGSTGGTHCGGSLGTLLKGTASGGSGTYSLYGNNGATTGTCIGTGGGGAGSAASGYNGGAAISISITGTAQFYGGGGGSNASPAGTGGTNAGNGAVLDSSSRTGIDAAANFGGGGGGINAKGVASGSGGSGIVIIKY